MINLNKPKTILLIDKTNNNLNDIVHEKHFLHPSIINSKSECSLLVLMLKWVSLFSLVINLFMCVYIKNIKI